MRSYEIFTNVLVMFLRIMNFSLVPTIPFRSRRYFESLALNKKIICDLHVVDILNDLLLSLRVPIS
jgi:hypothetical protein